MSDMTIEDAIAWCAARDVTVMFRENASMRRSVMVIVHGSPVKAEKPTLVEAVEEVSKRVAGYKVMAAENAERQRHRGPGPQQAPIAPDLRIP